MVLDHLIVESLDNNEEKLDVEALILHGLKALFEDTGEKDIKYDDADIEKLLDRSQMEETVDSKPSDEASLGSFKMARIWANSTAQIEDLAEESDAHLEVGYWDRIIQERMSLAQAQKLAAIEEAGRGKRRAQKVMLFVKTANWRLIMLSSILPQSIFGPLIYSIMLSRRLKAMLRVLLRLSQAESTIKISKREMLATTIQTKMKGQISKPPSLSCYRMPKKSPNLNMLKMTQMKCG